MQHAVGQRANKQVCKPRKRGFGGAGWHGTVALRRPETTDMIFLDCIRKHAPDSTLAGIFTHLELLNARVALDLAHHGRRTGAAGSGRSRRRALEGAKHTQCDHLFGDRKGRGRSCDTGKRPRSDHRSRLSAWAGGCSRGLGGWVMGGWVGVARGCLALADACLPPASFFLACWSSFARHTSLQVQVQ